MASKAFHPKPAFEPSRYPTIPTIDPEELERAQVRGRELQGQAVRDAFSGLFRAVAGLLSGTRSLHQGRRGNPPFVASKPS